MSRPSPSALPAIPMRPKEDLVDGIPMCRSVDCKGKAEFRAEIPKRWARTSTRGVPRLIGEGWEGDFCHYHLLRALELKVFEVEFHDVLRIVRLAR